MSRRERFLLIIVIAILALGGLSFGGGRVSQWFTDRNTRLEDLENQIHRKKMIIFQGAKAQKSIEVYQERSLPSESELASSRYRAWLHQWLNDSGVSDHQVAFQTAQRFDGLYDKYSFSVSCQGDLDQWVELLFDFYTIDHLHRIKTMSAQPRDEGNLQLSFVIEALALPTVAADKKLTTEHSKRLAFENEQDYFDMILNRNPYGPPHKKPSFTTSSSTKLYLGRKSNIRFRARDPEGKDVHYQLVGETPQGAEFDSEKGELDWTPSEKGKFKITILAEDEGTPPKSVEKTFELVVDDPPKVTPRAVPAVFDLAKYTFLTAVVAVNGKPQAWFHNRPQGKLYKLFKGDEFEIGAFRGKIELIQDRTVEIRVKDTVISVRTGQNLREGNVVRRDTIATNRSE